jgi:putative acetyltransferase
LDDLDRLNVLIRCESISDRDTIRPLTARAFSGLPFSDGTEPLVIDALRRASALALSLVAVLGEQVVGHVAFSEVGPPEQSGWFALGPVSVEPSLQRRGVGSRLIEAGLQALRDKGAKGCVLVGDHRYYHRFGFVLAPEFAPPSIQPSISRSSASAAPLRMPPFRFIPHSRSRLTSPLNRTASPATCRRPSKTVRGEERRGEECRFV